MTAETILVMPNAEYHAHPSMGSSTAKIGLKSMRLLKMALDGELPRIESAAFDDGTIFHSMALEGEKFARESIISPGPINPKTGAPYGRDTKAFAEWQSENPSTVVVSDWMLRSMESMPEDVSDILSDGVAESSVFVTLPNGLAVKCRPDWLRHDHMYDLKTCTDVDDITHSISKYRYDFSAAWYRAVMRAATGRDHQFTLIFAEKSAPYRWRIVDLAPEYVAHADAQCAALIERIGESFLFSSWIDDQPILQIVQLPRWIK